jgi:CRISPR system Cascade subunit CasE
MFLSKLVLNLRNPQARRDLARPYELHRTLMTEYPYTRLKNQCDLLFRVDAERGGPPVVLVQTQAEPNWSNLASGYLHSEAQCKQIELAAIRTGLRLRFRLRANPTKRVAARNERLGNVMAGKRVGLVTEVEQIRWLLRKGESGGFRIPGQWVDARHPETDAAVQLPNFRVDAVPESRDRNGKPGHEGDFVAVRFDGLLEVTDPNLFQQTISSGIGSAKAFGFGLLSVAPGGINP